MLNCENQLNLSDIYSNCSELFREQRPEFLTLLDKYIDINTFISFSFRNAFHAKTGRPRGCSLYGYISALILQKIFNIPSDTLLILILNFSKELRSFCGISNVPDASKLTRFKQDFSKYLEQMFIDLVDVTEPICRKINPFLSNMLSYDTSAVESYVTENNPKHINSTINKLKSFYKFKGIDKSNDDIYKQAFCSLPKTSSADSSIRKMYANGHFCYGRKFGIITNGLGIPRHIDFFDDDFKSRHKNYIYEETDTPDFDKSISDNRSLQPIFNDFYNLHPSFKHSIFLGDAAFDSYSTYDFLLKKDENGVSLFDKAFIPLNSRAVSDMPNCPINQNGIPVCPHDNSLLFLRDGICHENGRADRVKWRCPKMNMINGKWACSCENPCSSAKRGRTAYTTPSRNLRLYPGTIRGTKEWNTIYKIRGTVEQAINHIKSNMGVSGRKTRNLLTTKADVFLAGIAQLFTVIIADAMLKPQYIRSIKKLAC
ncbi:MAG: transposase [Clostridia bacterium]|nr:transposase [Clostridia bacterium]